MEASMIQELLEESVSSFSESDDDSVDDKTYKPLSKEEVSEDEDGDDGSNHEQADPVEDREDSGAGPSRGRKRTRNPQMWKRNVRMYRKERGLSYKTNSGKIIGEKTTGSPCKCRRKCYDRFSTEERSQMLQEFKDSSRNVQDQVLAGLIVEEKKLSETKHRRNEGPSRRKFSRHYFLKNQDKANEVCKKMFLGTFGVTGKKARIITVKKRNSAGEQPAADGRGKHGKQKSIPEEDIDRIKNHIKKFPAYKSHYSRTDSNRKYLDPNLSISEMYRLYVSMCEAESIVPCKEHTYRKVFNEKFNLSFHHPVKDTCGKCDEFKAKLMTAVGREKMDIEEARNNHHCLAEKAYLAKKADKEHAATTPGVVTASFDLQKVLPCPFLQTGIAFYKRQLAVYNLTIFETSDKGVKAHCMLWDETIAGRGSEEIGSALLLWLERLPPNITDVRLYSDCCSGQNRNVFLSAMLMEIAYKKNLSISHTYLEPGHTHMEADTIHAAIEKQKKNTNAVIEVPRDWANIIRSIPRKNRLQVTEMKASDFLQAKNLFQSDGPLVNRKKNTDKENIQWLKIKRIVYAESIGTFLYKTSFEQEAWKKLDLRRTIKGRPTVFSLVHREQSERKIPAKKLEDLIDLLPYISESSKLYYKALKSDDSNTFDEYLDEPGEMDIHND